MHPWYFLIWTFFFLEITFCGLSSQIAVGLKEVQNGSQSYLRLSRDTSSVNESNPKNENLKTDEIKLNNNNGSSDQSAQPVTARNINRGTMVLKSKTPDKNFVNVSSSIPDSEYTDTGYGGKGPNFDGNQPKFDENAVQRTLIVVGGLALIILVYLGIKFIFLRKRKVNKRYGRIDSEMDLLDEIEDDVDSEEEDDTLFDVNSTRRSQF